MHKASRFPWVTDLTGKEFVIPIPIQSPELLLSAVCCDRRRRGTVFDLACSAESRNPCKRAYSYEFTTTFYTRIYAIGGGGSRCAGLGGESGCSRASDGARRTRS